MKYSTSPALANAFQGLRICSPCTLQNFQTPLLWQSAIRSAAWPQRPKAFSTTAPAFGNWLEPSLDRSKKMAKGRCRVATGGSTKGTTVLHGDYGLRLVDKQRRISAGSLQTAAETIKNRLRGEKYRLFTRKCCNVGVYVSGNEMRMGKGKGTFDHWATRMAVNQILFELRGRIHEQVARDALRLAGNKLPGQWALARKGEAPYVGLTKLEGVTLEELKRPRRKILPPKVVEKLETTVVAAEASSIAETPIVEAPIVEAPIVEAPVVKTIIGSKPPASV